jgi:acetyl-CoA C-acetyltransferase
MLYEVWLQLRGEAPEDRRIPDAARARGLGLTHNLGGYPGEMVSFVGVFGTQPGTQPGTP